MEDIVETNQQTNTILDSLELELIQICKMHTCISLRDGLLIYSCRSYEYFIGSDTFIGKMAISKEGDREKRN